MPRPTDTELAILEVLSELGSATVRQILKRYNQGQTNPAGYTTILKMIQIMTEKNLVEKDATKRPQIYKPRHSWSKTRQMLLIDKKLFIECSLWCRLCDTIVNARMSSSDGNYIKC